jgi:hypothetical protein
MDNQILLEVARLVSVTSKLMAAMAMMMLIGLVVLGWELWGITVNLRASNETLERVAQMTAEVLRRTPER